jgi:hypothetical protein
MATNVQSFWLAATRHTDRLRAEFPGGFVYVTSVDDGEPDTLTVAGRVVTADYKTAGRYLAGRTHRVSTPEEITAYEADLARRTEELRLIEVAKKPGVTVMPAPSDANQQELIDKAVAKALSAYIAANPPAQARKTA